MKKIKKDIKIEKIEIQPPLQEWKGSINYGLIILDASGKYHYFNHDGSYDGWRISCNYFEN